MKESTTTLAASSVLPVEEQTELTQLEAVIENGKLAFIEVGSALCRIRDGRLYRATHGSFQCYVEARWNFSRVQAHRLIEAANVVKLLPIGNTSPITNEAQARALAEVPQEKRAEVLDKVVKAGKKITAKKIKEAAIEVLPPEAKSEQSNNAVDSQGIHLEEIKSLWVVMDAEHRKEFLQWTEKQPTPEVQLPAAWKCNSCGETFDTEEEAVTLYECGACGEIFSRENSANGDSHKCPSCNKFGSKHSEHGCPECQQGELEPSAKGAAP